MTETRQTPADFAALADAGWAALERESLHGWDARFASGVTKRANSAWARSVPGVSDAPDTPDASPEALAAIEAAYRRRGLAPAFQLAADDPVGARLIGRGYRAADETLVLAASLAPDLTSGLTPDLQADADVTLADAPDDEWLSVWWAVDGRGGAAELETARRILAGTPALYAGLRLSGALVSVARLALVGSWGGLYCVATLPEQRRRGHSRRVIGTLLAAARQHGVTDAWLQVLAGNRGAIALYTGRFGFTEVDRYRYFVGTARPLPAAVCR
jgi:N-acetylglutamate synthase